MNNIQTASWYAGIIKPSWAPPSYLFGPVWTVLYAIIAVTFIYVVYLWAKKRISFSTVLPFFLNLIFNISFSPIQFGFRNFGLATVDILLTFGTIIWFMVAIRKQAKWVVYANIPYLA
jgi:tryptophan-rich sensory protein